MPFQGRCTTCPCAGLGAQPSRWTRISAYRLREIWKPVPMSRDNSVRRCRTWKFSHTLYTSILPEERSGLNPASTIDPFVLIEIFSTNFSSKALNPSSTSICESPARLTSFVFHAGKLVPQLPLCQIFHLRPNYGGNMGFIQTSSTVSRGLSILQPWLDALWTPVGSKLRCDHQYLDEFLAPDDAAFVYFLIRGEPALGTGGRGRRKPKAPAVSLRDVRSVLVTQNSHPPMLDAASDHYPLVEGPIRRHSLKSMLSWHL